ncbi:hypothetical protein BJX99DRAFT_260229 [Aspergillus californicus]
MHYYLDRPQRDGKDSDEWKPTSDTEAEANIVEWYRAGRPFFPRDSLQSIRDQLQRQLSNGDLILVKGFDGLTNEFTVRTGDSKETYDWDTDGNNPEAEPKKVIRVFGAPQIYYTSYEGLKRNLEWSLSRAYLSIGIAHLLLETDGSDESAEAEAVEVDAGVESFNAILGEWEASDAWKEIKTTLLSLDLQSKIHKVVGMASGWFTATSTFKGSKRSAIQNALLVTLKKALQESHLGTDDVPCYAQDPAYSKTDDAVLAKSGVEVVEDPEGFLQIDDNSLVFSCSPNICVKQIVAEIARPLVLIWCEVEEEEPKVPTTDPNSPRVREMIATEYDKLPFPDDDNTYFTSMAIYVKKEARVSQRD